MAICHKTVPYTIACLAMSIRDDSNVYEPSIHLNATHSIWPGIDSLLYCPPNEDFKDIAESIDCTTGDSSDQGRILPMEEVDIAPSAFSALSFDEDMVDNQEGPPSHMAQVGRYLLD